MSDTVTQTKVETAPKTVPDVEAPTTKDDGFANKAGFWTRKRKTWAFGCLGLIAVLLIVLLPIMFLVIVPKIAQSSIDDSVLTFVDASISNPQNSSFTLSVKIDVTNAGHFDATLIHNSPLKISWIGGLDPNDQSEKPILEINMGAFSVSGGKGTIEQTVSNVTVLSEQALTAFNKLMVISPSFKWRLQADMWVRAVGRTYKGLTMDKIVELKGMDQLKGTAIRQFQPKAVPDPAQPLPIAMNATLKNPSPIGIELDTIVFNVTLPVPGTNITLPLGQATSIGKTMLKSGGETTLPLDAVLAPTGAFPPAIQEALAKVLGGQANAHLKVVPISVGGDKPVSWVAGALIGLPLDAELGKAPA
ncbi:hypothetical protein SpCBS45565_g07693 [Spizellomyces sp. 'palustris']|nr:hypothetical protein SpCBS45565_g07693 [Spizellomyces sp. 'palustris']